MTQKLKTLISKKGYGIFLDSISENELEKLKKVLTVKPNVMADYDFGEDSTFPVYRLSDTRIYVPRYYGLKHYGDTKNQIKDGKDVKITFNGTLKPHQVDFCEKVLKELNLNHSCIAVSATGSGKTAMGLWLISQIKKRTLIIVHKEFLLNQWIERIKQFLPNASIGIIKQNKCELDKDIIIGMIQTITKRDYPADTFKNIHCTVFDEAHHLGAEVFSSVFFKIGSKINLGLSATIKRADGLTKVIEWFLGSIIKNEILSEIEKPTIKFIEAEYSTNIVPKFNYKGNLILPNLINQLVIDDARNNQIINEIISLNKEGRKILVLSGRRGHCELIADEIKKHGIISGLYLGGMTNEKLEESNKANVIVGTFNMISEAYDNPTLDTLIMTTGIGAVQQSVGRILRQKNKFYPLVVDFTDIEYLGNQARRRKQFYKKNGYKILGQNTVYKQPESDSDSESEDICLFEDPV